MSFPFYQCQTRLNGYGSLTYIFRIGYVIRLHSSTSTHNQLGQTTDQRNFCATAKVKLRALTDLQQDAVGDTVDAAPPGPPHFLEEPERAVDVATAHTGLQNRVHDDGVEQPAPTQTTPRCFHLLHDLRHTPPRSALRTSKQIEQFDGRRSRQRMRAREANLGELPAAGEVDNAGGEAAKVGGRGGEARARARTAAGGTRGGEDSGSIERPAEAGLARPWHGRGGEKPRRPYQHHLFSRRWPLPPAAATAADHCVSRARARGTSG